MAGPERSNPYVGPVAFEREDAALFFGRDREAASLASLLISESVVLFYAQSGAGKTSLVNARLIPQLETKGFEVLPVVRVGIETRAVVAPQNIHVFNTLCYLSGLPQEHLNRIENKPLREFLQREVAGDDELPPRILIFDQFEEILTCYPERRADREDFFLQLRAALGADPLLSVLFMVREDHIAGLDRFARLLPGRLRTRFRMERLRFEDAITAIRRPAQEAGRPFADGVAEALADNLRQERIAGQEKTIAGEYVESVQLQVVCRQLWENLRDRPGERITQADVDAFGDVDRALEVFYEGIVERVVRETGVSPAQIRRWFEETLITPSRRRSQVEKQPETTGGLPNQAVDWLVAHHLIRAEVVRGGTWYELVHDRLVDPILASNERWLPAERFPLLADAKAWERGGRDPSFLPPGQKLAEAIQWANANREVVGELEREFLDEASNAEVRRGVERARATRRLRRLAGALAMMLFIALGLLAGLFVQARRLEVRGRLIAALKDVDKDPQASLESTLQAWSLKLGFDRVIVREFEAVLHRALHGSRATLVWTGRNGQVGPVALSPDGKLLATAIADGGVKVWDIETGDAWLTGHASVVTGVAFTADGTRLATVGEDAPVQVWDIASGTAISTLSGHADLVYDVAFSPDGESLVTVGEDASVRLWDAASATELRRFAGHVGAVYAVAFRPDGERLATGGEDDSVKLWDAGSGMEVRTLVGHRGDVHSVAFSPDGRRLASAGDDALVMVWDAFSGTEPPTPVSAGELVLEVTFSPDGRYLVTVGQDGTAGIRNLSTGEREFSLSGDLYRDASAISSSGKYLAMTAESGRTRVWELHFADVPTLVGREGPVRAVAFSPDGKHLATAGGDRSVVVWDAEAGQERFSLNAHKARVNTVAFGPQSRLLASASDDHTARVWDALSGEIRHTLSGHTNLVMDVVFGPDGGRLATASCDGTAKVWDLASGEILLTVGDGNAAVYTTAFSPDGKLLATAGEDGTLRLWDSTSGAEVLNRAGHQDTVTAVTFGPDGELLATASDDHTAKVWAIASGQVRHTLSGHTSSVTAVAFSPDGRCLATSGRDNATIFWDAASGLERFRLPGHTDPVESIAFSPDGARLATASLDGTVRLVPLRLEELLEIAEKRLDHPGTVPDDLSGEDSVEERIW